MKLIIIPFLTLFSIGLFAQQFSQITTGTMVTGNVASGGCSWADYNNDSYPDLFISNSSNFDNQLFKNKGDGTFEEITVGDIVNDGGISNSAVWGDCNNDGNLDLFVSNNPPGNMNPQLNFLYKNNGAPNYDFTTILIAATQTDANYTWSSSWVDYDNDGDLDLHMPENKHLRKDFFYENNGDETFTAVTPSFVTDEVESTGVVSWIDYDHDGDQDLFMIKSGRSHPLGTEDNRMYQNTLKETGTLAFKRVLTSEMVNHFDLDFQASWGDYDNDGDMDVYLGNFDNSDYLYRNEGDSLFTQINSGLPVSDNTRTLGSTWGDFDNDGDLDLFVGNTSGQLSNYYQNDGNGNFTSLSAAEIGAPITNISNVQGCANADYNNDGYLDLFVANNLSNNISRNYLYLNNGGTNNFLAISCKGTISNAAAIGTKVWVKAIIDGNPKWQLRHITGNPTGNHGQDDLRVHFGMGDAEMVDSIIIEWQLGAKEIFTQVAANQFLNYTESPVSGAVDLEKVNVPLSVYPNPFEGQAKIKFEIKDSAQPIQLTVLDSTQKIVSTLFDGIKNKGIHEVDLNTQNWPSGTYFLLLKNKGNIISETLLILE